jgi:hypothetical protein
MKRGRIKMIGFLSALRPDRVFVGVPLPDLSTVILRFS